MKTKIPTRLGLRWWGAVGLFVLISVSGCKNTTGPKYPDPGEDSGDPRDKDKHGLVSTPNSEVQMESVGEFAIPRYGVLLSTGKQHRRRQSGVSHVSSV